MSTTGPKTTANRPGISWFYNVATVKGRTWSCEIRDDRLEAEAKIAITVAPDGRAKRLTISHADGLTGSQLARLPWSKMLTTADASLRDLPGGFGGVLEMGDSAKRESTRPGRKGHPDEFYKAIAARYQQLRAEGNSRPVAVIADEEHVSRDTAGSWVKRARARGLLPVARPRRAG